MKRVLIIAGALACMGPVLAAEPAGKPGQVEFKCKFEPGRTIRQRVVSQMVGGFKMPGPMPEQKMEQSFGQTLITHCREVRPDGSAVMEVSLGDITMHMSMGPITLDIDSRTWKPGQAGDPMAMVGKIFSAMNGAKFTVTVSKTGQPQKVEGLTQTMKKVVDSLGDDKESAMARSLFDSISSAMGDESMTDQINSFWRMVPPRPGLISVGEKWGHTWSLKLLPMMGNLQGKGEYELLGVEDFAGRRCAKVRVKETFSSTPAEKQADKPNASQVEKIMGRMSMEMSSTGGDGIAYVDLERGEVLKMRQVQNISVTMNIAGDPNEANEEVRKAISGMTYKSKNTVSLDLVEEGAGQETKPATQPAEDAATPAGT